METVLDHRPTLAAETAPAVRRSVSRVQRLIAASLPRGPLSQAKLSAMGSLWRDGPSNAKTLSRRMTIRPQSLTRVLADLEAEGLVMRTRAAGDGRQHVLHLTAEGEARVRDEGLRRNALLGEVMQQALDRNEIELLGIAARILDKLADRWTAGQIV